MDKFEPLLQEKHRCLLDLRQKSDIQQAVRLELPGGGALFKVGVFLWEEQPRPVPPTGLAPGSPGSPRAASSRCGGRPAFNSHFLPAANL